MCPTLRARSWRAATPRVGVGAGGGGGGGPSRPAARCGGHGLGWAVHRQPGALAPWLACPPHPANRPPTPPTAGWAYSESLVRVLDDYRRRFPWLWAAIEADASPGEAGAPAGAQGGTAGMRMFAPVGLDDASFFIAVAEGCASLLAAPPHCLVLYFLLLPPAAEFKLDDVLPDQPREQQLEQARAAGGACCAWGRACASPSCPALPARCHAGMPVLWKPDYSPSKATPAANAAHSYTPKLPPRRWPRCASGSKACRCRGAPWSS